MGHWLGCQCRGMAVHPYRVVLALALVANDQACRGVGLYRLGDASLRQALPQPQSARRLSEVAPSDDRFQPDACRP